MLAVVTGAALVGFATSASVQTRNYERGYYGHVQFGVWQNEDNGYVAAPMAYGGRYMSSPAEGNACKYDTFRDPTTRDYSRC